MEEEEESENGVFHARVFVLMCVYYSQLCEDWLLKTRCVCSSISEVQCLHLICLFETYLLLLFIKVHSKSVHAIQFQTLSPI